MSTIEPDLSVVFDATDRVVVFGDIHGDATALRLTASRSIGGMRLTRVLVSVGDSGQQPRFEPKLRTNRLAAAAAAF